MRWIVRSILAILAIATGVAWADDYPVILRGKVTFEDGSIPKGASIQRICSDEQGSAPGPLIDKNGEYLWRMQMDPMRTRVCRIEASLTGYVSSSIDISAITGYNDTQQRMPTIILSSKEANPRSIDSSDKGVPSKAAPAFRAAMKAMTAGDYATMVKQMEAAQEAAPQFARGWNILGLGYERLRRDADARGAFEKAMAADPKTLAPFVNVELQYVRAKEWDKAIANADVVIKADTKKLFGVVYMHKAVAQFRTNDLAGAQASAEQAIAMDPAHKNPRSEYILGRILAAKGDLPGAKTHIAKYFELDPTSPDLTLLNEHYLKLGTPEGATVDPALEL